MKNSMQSPAKSTGLAYALALVGVTAVGVTLLVSACSEQPGATCDVPGVCTNEPDAGNVQDTSITPDVQPQPDAPPACDPKASPKDSLPCVTDSFGVFLAPTGDDTAAGTQAKPVKTFAGAVAKLAGKTRIYVCAGTYTEAVALTAAVSIYGGFDCAKWVYAATNVVRVESSDIGKPALTLTNAVGAVVEDVDLVAKPGAVAGGASVAAMAVTSTLTFRRVRMFAMGGGAAKDGAQDDYVYAATVDGAAGAAATGGAGGESGACPGGGQSKGGAGGDTGADGADGTPAGLAGAKGTLAMCMANAAGGTAGTPAPAAAAGAGAKTSADVTATGLIATAGTPGDVGKVAGGGGGGGGNGAGGGGGGAGGCGGKAGQAGGAGGSSLALLSFTSELSLVACTLQTADGKNGGVGHKGQVGQTGGKLGAGNTTACSGGAGGKGADGGAGGGGAGGLSVGVLYKLGKAPVLDAATSFVIGAKGLGGLGGDAATNKGVDGDAKNTLGL